MIKAVQPFHKLVFFHKIKSCCFAEKKFLVPGKPYNATLNYNQKLLIYCYRGVPKHLLNVWQTAFVSVIQKFISNIYIEIKYF